MKGDGMLYPFTFQPIYKERVWGGRKLETLYGKRLPPGAPIGESWEISDRPGDVSVISNGALAGKDLHWLMENHGEELLGKASAANGRFPLLIKILDAQDTLSLQVHPPKQKAAILGGEPKTELWYIADADREAELFVGLKQGTSRQDFEKRLGDGSVADCFHRVKVQKGDAMFLPSGRVHALGAGLVIFEIQQNSDTTYRVFDWNRKGLDGKPRELHLRQAMASIDFEDFEPPLVSRVAQEFASVKTRSLVEDSLFRVEVLTVGTRESMLLGGELRIVGVVEGRVTVAGQNGEGVEISNGGFCLIPASIKSEVRFEPNSTVLFISPGSGAHDS
jgi:mannose-6-phosphate isomerase